MHSHLVCVVGILVLFACESAFGVGTLNGPQPPLSDVWQGAITGLTIMVPNAIVLLSTVHALHKLKEQNSDLQRSLQTAEELATKLVRFDLDELDESSDDLIVNLLLSIAKCLKEYQPYLPAHLRNLSTGCRCDDTSSSDDSAPGAVVLPRPPSLANLVGLARRSIMTSGSADLELQDCNRGFCDPCGSPTHAHRPLRPETQLAIPLESRSGSLLYIVLPELEWLSTAADHSTARMQEVHRVCEYLAELVVKAAHDTKGIVQTLGYDRCLICWNLSLRCALHAAHALTAAVQIRDSFLDGCREHGLRGTAVSLAAWSGHVVCGSIGSSTLKSFSLLGPFMSEVCRCSPSTIHRKRTPNTTVVGAGRGHRTHTHEAGDTRPRTRNKKPTERAHERRAPGKCSLALLAGYKGRGLWRLFTTPVAPNIYRTISNCQQSEACFANITKVSYVVT